MHLRLIVSVGRKDSIKSSEVKEAFLFTEAIQKEQDIKVQQWLPELVVNRIGVQVSMFLGQDQVFYGVNGFKLSDPLRSWFCGSEVILAMCCWNTGPDKY